MTVFFSAIGSSFCSVLVLIVDDSRGFFPLFFLLLRLRVFFYLSLLFLCYCCFFISNKQPVSLSIASSFFFLSRFSFISLCVSLSGKSCYLTSPVFFHVICFLYVIRCCFFFVNLNEEKSLSVLIDLDYEDRI